MGLPLIFTIVYAEAVLLGVLPLPLLVTPAFLIIPMLRFLGARAEQPRARAVARAVLFAGAGLMAAAAVPLARDAITNPLSFAIVIVSFLLIASARVDSLWIMLGAALVGLIAFQF